MRLRFILLIALSLFLICENSYSQSKQYKQAQKLLKEEKFEQAIKLFTQFLSKTPTDKDALYGRATCNVSLGNFNPAIADMNKFISLDSTDADAYNLLGLAKLYSDSIMYSIDDFNKAIALDTNLAEAYTNRALYYLALQLDDAAAPDIQKAIKIVPTNPQNYNYYGYIQYRSSKYDSAIAYYNSAIQYGLSTADIYLKRGNSFLKKGQFQSAIHDYTKAITIDSALIDAWTNRAFAHISIGDTANAESDKLMAMLLKENKIGINLNEINTEDVGYFTHPSGKFSVIMPKQFYELNYSDTFALVQLITLEKIDNPEQPFSCGMIIEYIEDTQSKLGVSDPPDLTQYCKGLASEISSSALFAQPFYEKQKQLPNGSFYQMIKLSIQYTKDSPKQVQYIIGFIRRNHLITMRYIYPEELSEKFDKILQKAIDSFKFD